MRSTVATLIVACAIASGAAFAQVPPAKPAAAPAKAAPSAAAPMKAPAAVQKCMRLPLSDIAVGRPETIAQAQLRLKEYSEAEAGRRGWKGPLVKSNEIVSCEDYLYLPVIGQEYKCLVTATFCTGPSTPASKPVTKPVASVPKPAPKVAN